MYSTEKQKELVDLSKTLLPKESPVNKQDLLVFVRQLTSCINYNEWRYYSLNQPVLSDYEFDQLFKKLQKIEALHPHLIDFNSPTQRVSNDLTEAFETVKHLTPTLSLDNSYNTEDLQDFDERVKKLIEVEDKNQAIEYCVEPKFDGGTIVLIYENDRLVRAATRGNGTQGDEITLNAKAIRSIPLIANFSAHGIQKVELRGEVLIRKDLFEKVNDARAKKGEALFANPRNAATGGLRLKNPKKVQERALDAFIYQMGYATNQQEEDVLMQFEDHNAQIELLANLGFKVPKLGLERAVCSNIKAVAEHCQKWQEAREDYPFEIDGMVVKVNNLELQDRCGYTSHHPRWAIAFKFKAKQATTKLLSVDYQVGRTGAVTPVARLMPIELAGATISNVSLHNADFIQDKDIRVGDTVLVERAGDVIPYIVKPMGDLRDGSEKVIIYPNHCPVCEAELFKPESEAVWRCVDYLCEAQVVGRMIHFVSKNALNIDGFGEAYIERFYKEGLIRNLADIYRLNYDTIAFFEGFGQKSAENLRKAIEQSKTNPAYRLLYALGIRHIGQMNSKILVAEVERIQDLQNWSEEQLCSLDDIGPIVAKQVVDNFSQATTIELLDTLESLGVNCRRLDSEKKQIIAEDAVLAGKTVVFTGTLQKIKRSEAKQMVLEAGGKAVGSVSAKLSYLVAGEKAGSKLKKAQELGIHILSEDEFLALIKP